MPRSNATGGSLVKCQVDVTEASEIVTYWPGCEVPFNADFVMQAEEANTVRREKKLKGHDSVSGLEYASREDDSITGHVKYFLGVRKGSHMKIVPAVVFKMVPKIDDSHLNSQLDKHEPLTAKEQIEEIKEKFSSRKTKRQLITQRKYQIHFGENDVDGIETSLTNQEEKSSTDQTQGTDSPATRPKRTRRAVNRFGVSKK